MGNAKREKLRVEAELFARPGAFDSLAYEVAQGRGVMPWCREHGVRYTALVAWIAADYERQRQYDIAVEARGAATVAQLESIIQRTVAGELDPRRAHAVVRPLQWLAAVQDRKRFGEQVRVDHKHSLADDHLRALKASITVSQPHLVPPYIRATEVDFVEFSPVPSAPEPEPVKQLVDTSSNSHAAAEYRASLPSLADLIDV